MFFHWFYNSLNNDIFIFISAPAAAFVYFTLRQNINENSKPVCDKGNGICWLPCV